MGGVDEWAEDVKHGAEGERFAVGCEEGEGGVVVWSEDEGEGDAGDGHGGVDGWGDEEAVEGLEEVGGAGGGCGGATAVLWEDVVRKGYCMFEDYGAGGHDSMRYNSTQIFRVDTRAYMKRF